MKRLLNWLFAPVLPLYFGGDSGGGSSAPTQQTVTQTNLPDYARPYVEDMFGRASALTTQNPYQQYGGARVAGPSEMQQQAYGMVSGMQPAPQIGQATGMASDVFSRAQGVGSYSPNTNFNPGQSPQQVGTNQGYLSTGTGQWGLPSAQQYMDPYMQAVVDIQKREAERRSAMQGQADDGNAVLQGGDGAYGGTRNALVQAERERNLGQLENDIQAQGSSAAYSQALQAFNADQARALQSEMANQGAGLTAQGQRLQGEMANQGAGLTWNQQKLAAQQAGEQSRQFGAGLGLQGLQTQLGAAGLMGNLGQNQYNQQIGIAGLLNNFGQQYQGTQQAALDANYQDWVNQQMYPYRQLDYMNSILHGNYSPQTTTSIYGGYGSPVSQAAGLATAGIGLSRMMAKGGQVEDVNYRDIPDGYGIGVPSNYSTDVHAADEYAGPSYADETQVLPYAGLNELLISKIA